MPQMSPMWWVPLLLTNLSLLHIMVTMNFFSTGSTGLSKPPSHTSTKNKWKFSY